MFIHRSHVGVMAAAWLLAGCSFLSNTADSVWSTLSGEDSGSTASARQADSKSGSVIPIPPAASESNPLPTLKPRPAAGNLAAAPVGAGNLAAAPVTPGSPTGTYVGAKLQALRGDLQRLQDNINRHNADLQQLRQGMAQDSANYYSLVGTISSRLQVGTTPGNPELLAQWNQAQAALDRMADDIAKLNSLSNQTAADYSLGGYILDSVKAAYGLQGAVDEDHRQLRALEADVNRTTVLIDRLLNAISDDISRQSNYVSNERSNLVALSVAVKNGELYGQSLARRGVATGSAPRANPRPAVSSSNIGDRRPLVVIRFDRPNVPYEEALYTAVRRALERRPDATFDLVAVAPNAGNSSQVALHSDASKRNAENVLRSLTSMGLPPERVSLSATTSTSVQSDEVQLHVR